MSRLAVVTALIAMSLAAPAFAQTAPDAAPTAEPAPTAPAAEPAPETTPAPKPATDPAEDEAALERQLAEAEQRAGIGDEEAEAAPSIDRRGLTVEASIGVGLLGLSPEDDELDGHLYSARAGVNVGVGAFVTPSVAVGLRVAAASAEVVEHDFVGDAPDRRGRLIAAFVGPAVQFWPSERVFLGAGAGLAVHLTDNAGGDFENGYGLDARIGYNVFLTRHHVVHVAAEIFPTIFDDVTLVGAGLSLGWQML